jgi:indole-3-glycerol phosphate synthase
MSNVLERIVDIARDEVRRRKREIPLTQLEARMAPHREGRPFSEALVRPGVSIIAEHKRRSPSVGEIRAGATVTEIAQAYERGGAAALSVLTEGPHFGGSLADLEEARRATGLPILRKDFMVDAYQVYEAAVAGADAILLIVAALDDAELSSLHAAAVDLGLDVLVEVHDDDELARALRAGARVVGVNQRDLRTFEVDHERALRMQIPDDVMRVAESGVRGVDDARRLRDAGYDAILVGQTVVTAGDPAEMVRSLRCS